MERHRRLPGIMLGAILSLGSLAGCSQEKSEPAAPELPATAVAAGGASTAPAQAPALAPDADQAEEAAAGDAPRASGEPQGQGDRGAGRWRGRRGGGGGQRRAAMMAKFDKNGDGQVDDSERAAMQHARAAEMIEQNDTDRDGKLSQAEIGAIEGPGRRFLADITSADKDGDKALSAAELEALLSERMHRRGRPGEKTGSQPE